MVCSPAGYEWILNLLYEAQLQLHAGTMMMMMMMMTPLTKILPKATKGYVTSIQGGSGMGWPLVTMGLLLLQLLILALSKLGNFDKSGGSPCDSCRLWPGRFLLRSFRACLPTCHSCGGSSAASKRTCCKEGGLVDCSQRCEAQGSQTQQKKKLAFVSLIHGELCCTQVSFGWGGRFLTTPGFVIRGGLSLSVLGLPTSSQGTEPLCAWLADVRPRLRVFEQR